MVITIPVIISAAAQRLYQIFFSLKNTNENRIIQRREAVLIIAISIADDPSSTFAKYKFKSPRVKAMLPIQIHGTLTIVTRLCLLFVNAHAITQKIAVNQAKKYKSPIGCPCPAHNLSIIPALAFANAFTSSSAVALLLLFFISSSSFFIENI